LVVALGWGFVLGAGQVAQGQPAPEHVVTIIKVVEGQSPSGETYEYALTCDDPSFDSTGPLVAGMPVELSRDATLGPISCEIAETDPGAADEVLIQCGPVDPAAACTGSSTVTFEAGQGAAVTFTVRNTYPDPVGPPDVIPATPPFTG